MKPLKTLALMVGAPVALLWLLGRYHIGVTLWWAVGGVVLWWAVLAARAGLTAGLFGRASPRRWHYDEATGEYYRIREWRKGQPVLAMEGYQARFNDYYDEVRAFRRAMVGLIVSAVAEAGWLFLWKPHPADFHHIGRLFWLLLPVLPYTGIVLFSALPSLIVARMGLGPQPRTPKRDDFGASKAEAPADHAAADDLTYNPNA